MILSSCGKEDMPPVNNSPEPEVNDPEVQDPVDPPADTLEIPDVLGTYEFGGQTIDIYQVFFSENEYYVRFVFSPLLKETLTTYVDFQLVKAYMGKEYQASRLYHRDDYFFTYEDPVRLYSDYRQLEGGTILVKENPDGTYTVELDVLLNDRTPFKLSYTGNPQQ